MKILLADPYREVRSALRLVIEQQANFQFVGEARDMLELLNLMTTECPDVVLLDPDLPGLQMSRRGFRSTLGDLVAVFHKLCPAIRVIILSSLPGTEEDYKLAKADAFICKGDPPDALLSLLQQMLSGLSKKNSSKRYRDTASVTYHTEK